MKNAKKVLNMILAVLLGFSFSVLTSCERAIDDIDVASIHVERANPLISAEELMELIDNREPNLIIIGVIDPIAEANPQSISSRPIHGSFLVWRPDYSAAGSTEAIAREISGIRRSRAEMELLLSRADIRPYSRIIVYAGEAQNDAARFFWQLRLLGLQNISLLNGGLTAWNAQGFPTGIAVRLAEQFPVTRFVAPNYAPQNYNVSMNNVWAALMNPAQWVVIDTRAPVEFNGGMAPGMAGSFGTGRINGAVNVNWTTNFDPGTMMIRSPEVIAALYDSVILNRGVIVHCVAGIRAAHTWFVLSEVLGIPNVYLYNGGWVEWSFAASEASGNRWQEILSQTLEWNDNRMPL